MPEEILSKDEYLGTRIRSAIPSELYKTNYDLIFRKDKNANQVKEQESGKQEHQD